MRRRRRLLNAHLHARLPLDTPKVAEKPARVAARGNQVDVFALGMSAVVVRQRVAARGEQVCSGLFDAAPSHPAYGDAAVFALEFARKANRLSAT
ncbi:hypothetical protein MRX96_003682 [Rhipicephalus microplus]